MLFKYYSNSGVLQEYNLQNSFYSVLYLFHALTAWMPGNLLQGVKFYISQLVIMGDFYFMADGTRDMGSISVMPKGSKSRLSFSLEITNHNWKVAWIVNGERVRLDRTTRTGYYGEYELVTSGKIDFVRVEVYDYFGTLLLMTNPVYFTTDIKNIKNSTQGRTVYK